MNNQDLLMDEIDRELLGEFQWHLNSNGYIYRYVRNAGRKRNYKMILLHRMIAEKVIGRSLREGEEIDHINRARNDNRRCNIRVVTRAENMLNKSMYKSNSTGFTGVEYIPRLLNPFRARVTFKGKNIHLGLYPTAEAAGAAASAKRVELGFNLLKLNGGKR